MVKFRIDFDNREYVSVNFFQTLIFTKNINIKRSLQNFLLYIK